MALICAAGEAKAQVVQHAVEDGMQQKVVLLLSYKFILNLHRPYYIGYILIGSMRFVYLDLPTFG